MIELPWPSAKLSPNARPHFMALAREKKKHRAWANAATLAAKVSVCHDGAGGVICPNRIDVLVTAYPPTSHDRDEDNFIARLKSYFDGIADGLGVNDKTFKPRLQWGEPVKGGRVTFSILEGAQ